MVLFGIYRARPHSRREFCGWTIFVLPGFKTPTIVFGTAGSVVQNGGLERVPPEGLSYLLIATYCLHDLLITYSYFCPSLRYHNASTNSSNVAYVIWRESVASRTQFPVRCQLDTCRNIIVLLTCLVAMIEI